MTWMHTHREFLLNFGLVHPTDCRCQLVYLGSFLEVVGVVGKPRLERRCVHLCPSCDMAHAISGRDIWHHYGFTKDVRRRREGA
jgi:hypothetical protein